MILEHWNALESSFQAEYNINLTGELSRMTWRRFSALFNGLSSECAFVIMTKDDTEEIITDRVAATAAWRMHF